MKGLIVATLEVGVNDLGATHPELVKEWHPAKNGELTPQDFSKGMMKKIWWMCKDGHEWEAAIYSRARGMGCRKCGLKKRKMYRHLSVVQNNISMTHPELVKEWHLTKNGELTPQNFSKGSGQKIHWICKENHEWEAAISWRARGRGCPKCAIEKRRGIKCGGVVIGENDLGTIHPELVKEWHPTKNGQLTPQNFSKGSGQKIHWICKENHEWEVAIFRRSSGTGCPKCAIEKRRVGKGNRTGIVVTAGKNDLATTHPELVSQWHPTKNGELTPQNIVANSGRKVYWICADSHAWKAAIYSRALIGVGCPHCRENPIIFAKDLEVGVNDLGTTHPDLVAEWHPTKNGNLTPLNCSKGMRTKVWWVCEKGHEWKVPIYARTQGSGCAECSVGITEKSFREAFGKHSGFVFESDRIPLIRLARKHSKAQIDMLNDDLKLAIEYDGEFTHGENALYKNTLEQKMTEDKETTQALVDSGRNVIRIREHSRDSKLPLVPLDAGYESSVFQITYKSFGKDKDDIEELVQRIIEEKADWFKVSSELVIAA